jgi:hypothetical protein
VSHEALKTKFGAASYVLRKRQEIGVGASVPTQTGVDLDMDTETVGGQSPLIGSLLQRFGKFSPCHDYAKVVLNDYGRFAC